MNMKYNKYYIWLLSGLGCFVLFFKLLNIPDWLSISFDIISIFAGGIFASTVVAIFVEKINNKYYAKQIEEQKKILLNDIIICIQWLIKNELRCLDGAYYFSEQTNINRKSVTVSTYDSIDKILTCLEKIQNNKFKFEETTIIDKEYVYRQNQFESLFFNSSLGYYKNLNKYFRNIIDNKSYYLMNKVLTDKDLEVLMQTFGILDDIVRYNESKTLEYALEFKELLFKEFKTFVKHFELADYYSKISFKQNLYLD